MEETKLEELQPTETYTYDETEVNIYGELDIEQFAKGLYKLKIKYNI